MIKVKATTSTHTFPSELIWRPRLLLLLLLPLLLFKLELTVVVTDVLVTLLSVAFPVDVLSLFCVPGSAGKSSLLIVNSAADSDTGVLIIPTDETIFFNV